MDCLHYPTSQTLNFNHSGLQYDPKFTRSFNLNAELCGIWLGELPLNRHLQASILPAHMNRTPLSVHRVPLNNSRSHPSETTKTELPQRSSKKNSTAFNIGIKPASIDVIQKSESFEFPDVVAMRLNSSCKFQMEACRIAGSVTFSNGSLVFSSRDANLKIPAHLGGPGDLDLLSSPVQNSRKFIHKNKLSFSPF